MRIRIGSRDSQLAIKQTQIVMEGIQKIHPELELELITMKTTGDKILDRRLDQIGGKGPADYRGNSLSQRAVLLRPA